jgi:LPXTG-motif cell wall-anchored protein
LVVAIIGVGIGASHMGMDPMILHCGSVEISSATMDGQITLSIMGLWLAILSLGIILRDRRKRSA